MKVLILHNSYKIGGGEDIQTQEELSLLNQNGVDVHSFSVSNDAIDDINNVKLALNTIWSDQYYKELLQKIKTEKYDIVHIHNFFPLLSPSIFYAAKQAGAKVIMTAHNYRLICPNALMFIENKICNDCVGKTIPYPALFKKCYRDNFSATGVTVAMLGFHNLINTWKNKIDGIICISEFVKGQLVLGGFKEKQLHVKYNFVTSKTPPNFEQGDYYIYVGRTSNQKGIDMLLNTFQQIQKKLVIVGDGPLNSLVEEFVKKNNNIEFLGKLSLEETYKKIAGAKALISPSQSNEPFGRTIAEAFAHGTPAIGSSLGGITELIKDGSNGFLFDPYKESDLINAINKLERVTDMESMRKKAFKSYHDNFTPSINYGRLMEIYNKIISC
jgi:glycosyltransferase involved in cell wall biosynthesis